MKDNINSLDELNKGACKLFKKKLVKYIQNIMIKKNLIKQVV